MPTMPNVYGLDLQEAEQALQDAGVLNPQALGYFGVWPITIQWTNPQNTTSFTVDGNWFADSTIAIDQTTALSAPGTVIDQSIAAGNVASVNAALQLTVIQFPVGVSYP